jgi:glycosyltransferase involved in cell wall biosynthesis
MTMPPTAPGVRRTVFILHPSDLLTDHKPNGDGLIAFQFIRNLAARGHRLHIAVREAALQQDPPPNVTLYPIRCLVKLPLVSRLEYMVRVRRLFQKLRSTEKIDVLHQMNPVFTGLSLAFAGVRLPLVLGTIVPRWPEESADANSGMMRRLFSGARNMIAAVQQRFATALLLTSPAAMNRIPFPRQVQHKIRYLQHGVDLHRFTADSATRPTDGNHPVILFLANLVRRKGIFTLLEAFELVAARMPECRLAIAGGGEESQAVARLVKAMPCASSVDLLGSVDRAEACRLLRSCTVYCLPSFGEPFGTTILEAMSCGKPVVSTCTGGTPHFLPPEGGRLVP